MYSSVPVLQAILAVLIGKLNGIPFVLRVQDVFADSVSANATGFIKSDPLLNVLRELVNFVYNHYDLILGQSINFCKAR